MKLKVLSCMIVVFMLTVTAKAQFRISTGISVLYGRGQVPKNADPGTSKPTIIGYGLFLYPRYNIVESDAGAVSLGLPLTLGISGSVNSRSGGSISLTADVPLMLDYNVGAGATEDSEAGFGGFVGAGFGYTYTNQVYDYYVNGSIYGSDNIKGKSYGPLVHGGIKANIGEKIYFLRAFYKMGVEKEKYRLYGAAVGVSF
jgi:hypothetical protein